MNRRHEVGYMPKRDRNTPRRRRRRPPPLLLATPSSPCVGKRQAAGHTALMPPTPFAPIRRPPRPPAVALPRSPSEADRAGGPLERLPTRRRRLTLPPSAPLPAHSAGAGRAGELTPPLPRGAPPRRRPTPRYRRSPGCKTRAAPRCRPLRPTPTTPCRCVSLAGGGGRAALPRRRARRRRAPGTAHRLAAARGWRR